MNIDKLKYYSDMHKAERLLPLVIDGKFIGFITFFVANDISSYVDRDPWCFAKDNPEGDTIYIDQLITNKEPINAKNSHAILADIKQYFIMNFPNAYRIVWMRYKHGKTRRRECYVHSQVFE